MKSELIEVGDRIKNCQGTTAIVTATRVGKYGLCVEAKLGGEWFGFYLPYELPSLGHCVPGWHGWSSLCEIELLGKKQGCVSLTDGNTNIDNIEFLDTKWEETLKLMEEDNVSMSTLQESNIIHPVY